jgi:N-acetylmuramoyl-L-alanine amidase
MAQSVFKGIKQHFYQHPPAGTYVAAQLESGSLNGVERQHTVARGDSLSAVASRYGISMQRLQQYNNLRDTNVKIGQVIKIPGRTVVAAGQPAARSVQTPPAARPVYTPPAAMPRHHKVVAGDTLTRIASRYGVSASAIQRHNNMKSTTVKLGQTLKIPTS